MFQVLAASENDEAAAEEARQARRADAEAQEAAILAASNDDNMAREEEHKVKRCASERACFSFRPSFGRLLSDDCF